MGCTDAHMREDGVQGEGAHMGAQVKRWDAPMGMKTGGRMHTQCKDGVCGCTQGNPQVQNMGCKDG